MDATSAPNPPALAFDSRGDAVTAWASREGVELPSVVSPPQTETVKADILRAGVGTWQPPVTVSSAKALIADVNVSVDRAGDAVAVWTSDSELKGSSPIVEGATRSASTGRWSSPRALGLGEHAVIAMGRHGEAQVLWRGSTNVISTAPLPQGTPLYFAHVSTVLGRWGRPHALPGTESKMLWYGLAVGRHGTAAVAWESNVSASSGNHHALQVMTLAPRARRWSRNTLARWTDADWRTPSAAKERASLSCHAGGTPLLGFDGGENLVAVWRQRCGSWLVARWPAYKRSWTRPADFGRVIGKEVAPAFSLAPAGTILALWLEPGTVTQLPYPTTQPFFEQIATTLSVAAVAP